jgi:hypothetical protein
LLAVVLEHPHPAAVLQRLHAHAVGLLGRGIEERHVGDVDRQVLVDDAAGDAFHRVGPLVLLHPVHTFHHEVLRINAPQHRAALALVAPGEHDHFIAFPDPLHV